MADATVKLDIMAPGYWGPDVPAGWTASTGTTGFVYKYSGGNTNKSDGTAKDDGTWEFEHGSGEKKIEIKLITADGGSRYYISKISVHYDDETAPHDLTLPDLSNGPVRSCTVTNSAVDVESGTIKVTCNFDDKTGIICDPRWDND